MPIPPEDCDGIMCDECKPYGCAFPDKDKAEPEDAEQEES